MFARNHGLEPEDLKAMTTSNAGTGQLRVRVPFAQKAAVCLLAGQTFR